MRIGISHKAVAHLATAIADDATMIAVHPTEYEPILSAAPGDFVYLLIRGPANRELVKVTVDWAAWGGYLTIARGQGGTTARAWPAGSMLFATTHADHFNSIIQSGARTIDYNPNSILAPLYAGEKIYQSGPAGCERWWQSYNGVDSYWSLITGAPCGAESYGDEGFDWPILTGPSWDDSHFDDTNWELEFTGYGSWTGVYWDSVDVSSNLRVYLKALDAWNVGYEPTKVRLTIGGDDTSLKFNMKFGTQVHVMDTVYKNLEELDIDPAWYTDGPLSVIQLYQFNAWKFWLTKIEFLV